MQGEKFLKVTGIIMIVGGSLGIILGIVAALGVSALAYLLGDSAGEAALLYASAALVLISAIFELIAGIIGVKNCKKPEKAGTCITMGIIVAVLCVAGNILNAVAGSSISVMSLITGLALPVLYIIGASMNKKSA